MIPHDSDTERALLGAMLLGATPIRAAEPHVTGADFHHPAHATIFATILDLHRAGAHVDQVTLAAELGRTGQLESVGGHRALVDLAGVGVASGAATYAKVVAGHAVARRLLAASAEVAKIAGHSGDAGAMLEAAQACLAAIDVPVVGTPDGLLSIDTFLDRPDTSRAPWVIPGLVRSDWRVVLVAPEGVGKSVLTRSLAMLASQGVHPLSGARMRPTISLIVDLENPDDAISTSAGPLRALASRRSGYEEHRTWLWHRPGGIDLRTRRARADLEAVLTHVRPELVCLGPVYKSFRRKAGEDHEQAVDEVQQVLDDLRTRYRFGLVLEHHAPKKQGGFRDIEPFGSQRWLAWPELGLGLVPTDDRFSTLEVRRWRGDRLKNSWPDELHRGGREQTPWVGMWNGGIPDFEEGAA